MSDASAVHPEPGDRAEELRSELYEHREQTRRESERWYNDVSYWKGRDDAFVEAANIAERWVAAAVAAVRADLAAQIEALREGRHPTNWNEALDTAAAVVRGTT